MRKRNIIHILTKLSSRTPLPQLNKVYQEYISCITQNVGIAQVCTESWKTSANGEYYSRGDQIPPLATGVKSPINVVAKSGVNSKFYHVTMFAVIPNCYPLSVKTNWVQLRH